MSRVVFWSLAAAVAFTLLVATPGSAKAGGALTHVEHPNVLVTIDPEARSQNEVTIAAFPNNPSVLVATARDTRQSSGFSWAGYYRSTDGGKTWTNALVPGFPGDTSPEGLSSPVHAAGWTIGSDPVIAADREGRVYLAWLSFGPTTTQFAGWVVVTRYSDFGATYDFTSVAYVGHDTPSDKLGGPGNSRVTDKEWIAVDDTQGPCDGNLYMPWALFESSGGSVPIVFQRSTDGGRSWTSIIHLSHPPNGQNQGEEDDKRERVELHADGRSGCEDAGRSRSRLARGQELYTAHNHLSRWRERSRREAPRVRVAYGKRDKNLELCHPHPPSAPSPASGRRESRAESRR